MMKPYIDSSGCIQTKQILPEAPPREMIPGAVLQWEALYNKGEVSQDNGMSREQVYNVRRLLRRYRLLEPMSRNRYAGKSPEVQLQMRREKQRRYRQERRLQATAAAS